MAFQKLQFRPGINREATDYANEGGWYDCNLVRFRAGLPEKVGGWEKLYATALSGTPRSAYEWVPLDGILHTAIGTSERLYIDYDSTMNELTPVKAEYTLGTDPLDSVDTTTTVTVTKASHGVAVGDFVILSGAAGFNGIPAGDINKEHTVATVPTANTFTVEVNTAATATGSGGGASVQMQLLLSPGSGTTSGGSGWGSGAYSRGAYSSAFVSGSLTDVRLWSLAAYGEDLFGCIRDGEVFYWDKSLGSTLRPVLLSTLSGDCPTIAKLVATSGVDRRAFAFGCNPTGSGVQDPLLIRWSTTEDITNWTPGVTTSAGELRLEDGSQIVSVKRVRNEFLIWTDTSLYSLVPIGAPSFYGVQGLSSAISIVGPNATVAVNNVVVWMGVDKFYVYTGTVDSLPCSVQRYVFGDINLTQSFKFFGATNDAFNEVTWYYCSSGSTEIDKYVTYNHQEKVWYYGNLARTLWLDTVYGANPLAADPDGYLYLHEVGNDDGSQSPAVALDSYIQSSMFDIGEGESFAFVKSILPDIRFAGSSAATPSVTLQLSARNTPGDTYALVTSPDNAVVTRTATNPVDQYTNRVWVRLRGRQMAFRVYSDTLGVRWQLGAARIELQPDGRRA